MLQELANKSGEEEQFAAVKKLELDYTERPPAVTHGGEQWFVQ